MDEASTLKDQQPVKRERSVELDSDCAPAKRSKCSLECALKLCAFGGTITPQDQPRREVEADLPEEEDFTQFLNNSIVEWSPSGEAAFHEECWKQLMTSIQRQRSEKDAIIRIGQAEEVVIRNVAKLVQRHDSSISLKNTCSRIATLVKNAKHCVVFTGEAITFVGDEQERGKMIEMDPESASEVRNVVQTDDTLGEYGVHYNTLEPTYTHEALAKLVDIGIVKYVITENGDDLNRLSGISNDSLSEVRGNVFLEICEKCDKHYCRSFDVLADGPFSSYYEDLAENGSTDVEKPKHAVKCKHCSLNHRTGRRCEAKPCRGHLKDTIINSGDDTPESILSAAMSQVQRADLILSLGTTMETTPICNLVLTGTEPLQLVIVNTLETGYEDICHKEVEGVELGVRVFGDCDNVVRNSCRSGRDSGVQGWQCTSL